ncbi:MAG: M42 family metallopeptidase [Anaerolineales bacterium]|nr:M42 family metallopeptidase [Anaerolineales bacterium]
MKLQDTLLKELTEAAGVSGAEDEVRKLILNEIKDHVSDIRIDSMGNILAVKKGTGASSLRVMLAAHMDEVGFMVTGIDNDGLLQIRAVGGVDNRILPALRVHVGKKRLPGVIQWKPIHLSYHDRDVKKIDNLRVDIGAGSKGAAEGKVSIGDRVTFAAETIELSETVIRGKAFDDRAGCARLIEHCKGEPFPFDLLIAFTVQEEVGLRGASVLGESLKPDVAIVLESTACHEVPQDEKEPDITTVTKLGHGPAISYKDNSAIGHPGLVSHFRTTAEKHGIPHQFRSPQYAGGTDGGAIHKSIGGIPTVVVSLPCRYLHTPYSILNLEDYANGVRLVHHALMELEPKHLER